MKNPVFKAQVTALFEKTSFGLDPHEVAAKAPNVANSIRRGLGIERGFHDFAAGTDRLLSGAGSLASKVLTGGSGLGAKALGGVSKFIQAHPKAAIGTAVMAPILYNAFSQSQRRSENELMNAYRDPDRVITASLEQFLEKKAAAFSSTPNAPSLATEILKGFGGAIGGTVAAAIAQNIGSSFMKARSASVDEPKRRALLEQLFKTDSVLRDALARHPDTKTLLLEAFGTMVRFAPTLSLDINAVRSFLREAVLGGSGVNYATIKNLVDTERSVADSKQRFGGKH